MRAGSAPAVDNAPFGKVIRRQFHLDLVTGQDTNVMFTHPTGDMGGYYMTVFQLHPEHGIWEGIDHGALHFDMVFFRQVFIPSYIRAVI